MSRKKKRVVTCLQTQPGTISPANKRAKTQPYAQSRQFPALVGPSTPTQSVSEYYESEEELEMAEAPGFDEDNFPGLDASIPEIEEVKEVKEKPKKKKSVLGSSALHDDGSPGPASASTTKSVCDMTFLDFGYRLVPKYSGLFDPFGGDGLFQNLVSILADKTRGKQSRFERLFDDTDALQASDPGYVKGGQGFS